jgi:pimeloyl-ACP methyl ester carboxylesterase
MPELPISSSLTLFYLEYNPTGRETVLLLHGLGANADSWLLQIPALEAAGYHLLAPDLRGFGRSSYPGNFSIQAMAQDCVQFIQAVNQSAAHVVGISMGGTVALQLALSAPDQVKSLVLINTFARFRPPRPALMLRFLYRYWLLITRGLPAQARMVVNSLYPRPEQEAIREIFYQQILMANPKAYRAAMRSLARFNVYHQLNRIRIPALVITGTGDRTVTLSQQWEMARKLPYAWQMYIPGGGHGLTAEKPEAVNQMILDFLDTI